MILISEKSNWVKTDVQVAKLAFSMRWPWLDPMILILEPDLDIVKMYHHTKSEVSLSTGSKVIAQTDTHTHAHIHTHTTKTLPLPHTREVRNTHSIVLVRCNLSSCFSKSRTRRRRKHMTMITHSWETKDRWGYNS